jgi:hypothetical protein
MKIQETIKMFDGQIIYVMGKVQLCQIEKFIDEYNDIFFYFKQHGNIEHRLQYVMRKFIRNNCNELSQWLMNNNCQITSWIDTEIYQEFTSSPINFDWGIGFPPNDPKESFFVLRWS